MRKSFCKGIGVAAMLLMLFVCTCAWADPQVPETITVAEAENGMVQVETDQNDPTQAQISVTPDWGYMLDAIALKNRAGVSLEVRESDRVVDPETGLASIRFSCGIPEQDATLTVAFRRARVVLSEEEMALSSTGEPVTLTAAVSYTDGEVKTRTKVFSQRVVFASTKTENVSVDPASGKVTALQTGFSRITACPYYGNSGSEDFCYVIVDADKSEKVGTVQVNAWFEPDKLVEDMSPGHSFVLFRNTSGEPITIDTSFFYQAFIPTEAYYEAVRNYDGTGYDPVTYEYVTNGEDPTDENADARLEYVEKLFTQYEKGTLPEYAIPSGGVVSFGNSGSFGEDENIADKILGGEFSEVVDRYGLTWDLEKLEADLLSGRIDFGKYYIRLLNLAEEVAYDLYVGYNPFTARASIGGIYLNGEIRTQAKGRKYWDSVGIKTEVTEVQFEAMLDFYQYQNWFNVLSCNCTYSAATAWNIATCTNPDYHLDPNYGGYTSAVSAPLFLKQKILLQSTSLRYDENVTCYSTIGVIKPEQMAQPGTYGGTEIKPLFGNLKSNLTFQIVTLNTGETYDAKRFGVWESSDPSVVTVTGNGYMRAWSSGVAFVSCSGELKYFGYLVLVI